MASTSSIPAISFTPSGVAIPTTADVLNGALTDIDNAFGGGMSKNLETPQGQLATSMTAAITDKNAQLLYLASQFDPTNAEGVFQDSLAKIYFLTRIPAQSTSVSCTLSGVAGTIIPAGASAKDSSGNSYIAAGAYTIGAGGMVTGTFNNVQTGAIPCPAGTLTTVAQSISGWDTITNPTDGTLGRAVESRLDFEYRRRQSVATNGHGILEAIRGAVIGVTGVLDAYVTENNTSAAVATGATSYSLLPNSLYVGVTGGADADIAAAIFSKRSGCGDFNGNTSVTITDSVNYAPPYPVYLVKFNRPTATPVKFLVQILANSNLPVDIVAQTQAAIMAAFNGTDNGPRARIGASISSGRFYGGVMAISPYVAVAEILLGLTTPTLTNVTMGIDQQPTITASDITVSII